MTKVDCEDCFEKFTSKKLYINHVKSKSCPRTKAKNRQRAIGQSHQENGAKRVRLEGSQVFFDSYIYSDKVLPRLWLYLHTTLGDPLALVGGTGTFGPPVQGELQGASHFASPSRVAELQGQIKNTCRKRYTCISYTCNRNTGNRQTMYSSYFYLTYYVILLLCN